MIRSPLWREFESGEGILLRTLRFCTLAGGVVFLCFSAAIYLTWQQQLLLMLLTLCFAVVIDRTSSSYLVTLTLMLLSVFSTFRYGFWRVSSALAFFRDPGTHWTALDAFFIWLLLLAECYAFVVLMLGYLQMLWPLRRAPVALPGDPAEWPEVDLLIPTLNEPLSVVRSTALAARNIDWPAGKLHVCLLDDGRRDEFRAFAEEAGIGYIARDDNRHAKAGNINHALAKLNSPFLAVFDSDHVPTRSFLQVTMGWFLRDRELGILQTPHHFYSPDPFERNLDQFRIIPNEGELFYGVVQDGNDFWNATLFCGSCAVLRRSALDEVGGVAVETVTEDAHTSLRMQRKGWNTAYVNIPQAAGLATERLSGHVRQRIRWARGMVQILRIENPLFSPGLTAAQRLCYFNAMTHFLYALPRLIFLTAPLIYLIFGHTNIPGYWVAILAYAAPHLVLSKLTNSRVQGQHRHSFWNEIYETVLAPYIFLPTLLALLSPKLGRFNVTAKGGVVGREFFDARIARPFLFLLGCNVFGLLCAIPRFFQLPSFDVPWWLDCVNWPAEMYDGSHAGTIWVNVAWTLFNIVILGIATAVAWETQQRRQSVRMAKAVPSDVILPDGSMVQGITSDLSSGGVRTRLDFAVKAAVGDPVRFVFPVLDGTATLPATIVAIDGNQLRAQFAALNLDEEESLTMILYSRADTWLGWGEAREADHPLHSLGRILRLSLRGLARTLKASLRGKKGPPGGTLATGVVPLVLFGVLAGLWVRDVQAAQTAAEHGAAGAVRAAGFDDTFSLADAGVPDAIVLRGPDASHSIYFSLPRNQVVKSAEMRLRYHFSPGLLPGSSYLKVSLNGTLFATIPAGSLPNSAESVSSIYGTGGGGADQEAVLAIPPDLLVHDNQLTFEFIGHYAAQCEDRASPALWSEVDPQSTIELAGTQLALANDLNLLPLPFYDSGVDPHPTVPIVFLSPPSPKAMQAAGIIASWFGVEAGFRPVRFPVSFATIPAGNAIVLAEDASQIPASLNIASVNGPTLAMGANPADPSAKVLLLTGENDDELLAAAQSLAVERSLFEGDQVSIRDLKLPGASEPDDAPRWLSTGHETKLGDIAPGGDSAGVQNGLQTSELQSDGSVPLWIYFRLPPDLNYSRTQNLAFHLSYRYNGVPLGDASTLQIYMNGAYVSSTPLPHTDKASTVLDTVVPIPVVDLRPFSNSMMLRFDFQVARRRRCAVVAPPNLQGAILKDSYLEIAGIPHWTLLPNLELFANAGYPFSRRADLSDTAVVLPDQPTPEELEVFLALMGHFGAQTGSPALRVSVTNAAGMAADSGRDSLVIGATADSPALKLLDSALPVGVDSSGLEVRDTEGFFGPVRRAWGRVVNWGGAQPGQLQTAGGLPDALIEGVEWPAGSNRSAVVVVLRDPAAASGFLAAFLGASQSSAIAQSVSVLHGTQFSSYRIGDSFYRVGQISLADRLTLIFQDSPWLMALGAALVCLLMAAPLRAMLRRRARLRLHGDS